MLNILKITFIGALALAAGCASEAEKAKSADDAQRDANDKAAHAGDETQQKSDEVQRKADEDKARIANEQAAKAGDAQADATKKQTEAAQALVKGREDARQASETRLTGLEGQFAELKPKLVKKLAKKDSDTAVKDLTAKADAARKSIADLNTASADSLEPVKATIKQRLDDYEQALTDAKKRV